MASESVNDRLVNLRVRIEQVRKEYAEAGIESTFYFEINAAVNEILSCALGASFRVLDAGENMLREMKEFKEKAGKGAS